MTSTQRIRPGMAAVTSAVAQFFIEYPEFDTLDLAIVSAPTGASFSIGRDFTGDPVRFVHAMARALHTTVREDSFVDHHGIEQVQVRASEIFDGVRFYVTVTLPAAVFVPTTVRELVAA